MPPTVVCLGFPEHCDEDVHPDSSGYSAVMSDLLESQLQEGEGDLTKAPTSSKPRSSTIQPTRPPTRKRDSQDSLVTEIQNGSPRKTRVRKTTATSENNNASLKRKLNEVLGSDTRDAPQQTNNKRRGRKKMQKERDTESAGTASGRGSEADGGSDQWEVERIVGGRIEADTYIHWYEVKWKNWSTKHNTWEPKKNLAACQGLIDEFEALEQRKTKAKK